MVPFEIHYLPANNKPMKPTFVYITCKNQEEARKIGRAVVEDQLAACANIMPQMVSIYKWEGKMQEDSETVLILKSHMALNEELVARVQELHSYEVPAILTLPIVGGSEAYVEWMAGEMRV